MCAKTLKETETEETRLFFQMFVNGGISIDEARASLGHPLDYPTGYAYDFEIRTRP